MKGELCPGKERERDFAKHYQGETTIPPKAVNLLHLIYIVFFSKVFKTLRFEGGKSKQKKNPTNKKPPNNPQVSSD